jgi:hypothetical protein
VGIVEFPTRSGLNSQTANDSVFNDTSTIGKYKIYPLINGLSDHDAQLLILSKGGKKEEDCHIYIKIKINKYTIADCQLKLSHEIWEQVLHVCTVHQQYQSLYYPTNALIYINCSLLKPVNV